MYIGPTTDEPPIARPPISLKDRSAYQFQARAQPKAEATYSRPKAARHPRRP